MNIIDCLQDRAMLHPEKIIWEDENRTYSISEMEHISGKVYRYLKINGIGTEDIVAIQLPRSGYIPSVMLGVWKAGAAFIVFGEHSPEESILCQMKETKPKMVFDPVRFEQAMKCDYLDGYEAADVHDLACVVYSTGSTGVFKGSMHEYGEIEKGLDRTWGFCEFYDFSTLALDEYRLIFSAGFYTLTAVTMLIDSLTLCYYQYILPYESIGNISEIGKILIEKKINAYSATTRDYQAVRELNSPYLKELSVSLDMVSCSCTTDLPVYNYYGMSESVCTLSCFRIDRAYDIVPIGRPYEDIPMKIADKNGDTVPDGEIGEICFVPEFWRGYIGRPEKTKAVFYDGWFHTGDMGYVNEDGNYVLVGRKADIAETKSGYIVPAFIESAFRKVFSDVERCHVQIFAGELRPVVCLYYCGGAEYSAEQVRQGLCHLLPEYCLPTYCRKMQEFVYYPSGKLNRNTFANPEN